MGVGRADRADFIIDKENSRYHEVANIKIHNENHFAILTLKSSIIFDLKVGPLCLPKINRGDTIDGTILGFGYKENYGEWLKDLATNNEMINERLIASQPFQFVNSTLCIERFGYANTNFLKKKNWFLRKGQFFDDWYIPEDYWSYGNFWLQE